jgi:hypothetical protein
MRVILLRLKKMGAKTACPLLRTLRHSLNHMDE